MSQVDNYIIIAEIGAVDLKLLGACANFRRLDPVAGGSKNLEMEIWATTVNDGTHTEVILNCIRRAVREDEKYGAAVLVKRQKDDGLCWVCNLEGDGWRWSALYDMGIPQ